MSKVLEPLEEEKTVEQKPRNQEDQEEEEEEDHHEETSKKEELLESLCTPTSSDHKIPEVETCPPPPRKRPREICLKNKKRLSKDLRFFEATDVGSQEVETLFVHDEPNHVRKKRRSNSA
ncbi:PREDICTED: cyclin-dependent protein kinase inhibitor SMR2-like [Camelina sativa]|uniref:Cyclin-dependent protein kinase inhibitor SMR2-like n=1 Tax=Camelina sativa TaxID=90675 RepID=A0ABM0WSP2_CAMSA|nr:PREDICTED: cyclin-dependent protein kinase inhibitor SMR2-like [Camelina sativa]